MKTKTLLNISVLIFSTVFARNSSYFEKDCTRCDKIYIGLRVRYMLFFSDFIET